MPAINTRSTRYLPNNFTVMQWACNQCLTIAAPCSWLGITTARIFTDHGINHSWVLGETRLVLLPWLQRNSPGLSRFVIPAFLPRNSAWGNWLSGEFRQPWSALIRDAFLTDLMWSSVRWLNYSKTAWSNMGRLIRQGSALHGGDP